MGHGAGGESDRAAALVSRGDGLYSRTPGGFGARRALIAVLALLFGWLAPALRADAQTVIYVNAAAAPGGNGASWATAYRDVESALTAAEGATSGSVEIWVAGGTYKPTRQTGATARTKTFELRATVPLSMIGGFLGSESAVEQRPTPLALTTLSGDLNGDDTPNFGNRQENAYKILWIGTPGTYRVEGFTISGANSNTASGDVNSVLYQSGAGLYIYSRVPSTAIDATIVDCAFVENNAAGFGAAMAAASREDNNVVSVTRVAIDRCVIKLNQHGGTANAVLNWNKVEGSIRNSIIASNPTGGVIARPPDAQRPISLVNVTIANNRDYGLVTFNGLPVNVSNSILWNNGAGTEANQITLAGATVNACTVQNWSGTLGGTQNNATDPQFLDLDGPDNLPFTADDDFRLALTSPMIDAGDNALLPIGSALDASRQPRVFDGDRNGVAVVDRGALERTFPDRIYVNAAGTSSSADGLSWATAYKGALGLRQALANYPTQRPLEIWLARGTYTPSAPLGQGGSRADSFNLLNGVAIYGGFQGNETLLSQRPALPTNATDALDPAKATILSGDLNGDDVGDVNGAENAFHVVSAVSVDASALLEGLTLTAGRGDGPTTPGLWRHAGGGLLCVSAAPTVRRCALVRNTAQTGGAVYVYNASHPVFHDSLFELNTAKDYGIVAGWEGGAVIVDQASSGTFLQCVFRSNKAAASGGAVNVSNGSGVVLRGCTLVQNECGTTRPDRGYGGAVYATNSDCRLVNSVLAGNRAALADGAFHSNLVDASVLGCVVVGNTAPQSSGAIGQINGVMEIRNTSVIANEVVASNGAGGFKAFQQGPGPLTTHVANSIFWANSRATVQDFSAQFGLASPFLPGVTFSSFQGGSPSGPGNNALDPLFVRLPSPGLDATWGTPDDDYGNLRLSASSPAIDSGDALAVPPDAYDVDQDNNTTEALPLDLAGNPRFYDDPTRANTGSGSPPVDRGAYESNLATSTWLGAAGSSGNGSWLNGAHWSGGTPASTVRARFDGAVPVPAAYSVTVAGSASAYALAHSANQVTLNLSGGGLTLFAPAQDAVAPLDVTGTPASDPRLIIRTTGVVPRTMSAGAGSVAQSVGSIGALTVQGPRITLALTDRLVVGGAGSGSLTVRTQGVLDTPALVLGDTTGSSATALVQDAGSVLAFGESGRDAVIGAQGAGALHVTAGGIVGTVSDARDVVLGQSVGAIGTLSLAGVGTQGVIGCDRFIVGDAGAGVLSLSAGAELFTASASGVVLGRQAGSSASVTIGAGARWVEQISTIVVGGSASGAGTADVQIESGGRLEAPLGTTILTTGTVSGSGTMQGSVFNFGTIRPAGDAGRGPGGGGTGVLTVQGDYRQLGAASGGGSASGVLVLDVAGSTPGTAHDQLIVTGRAELGGGLRVQFAPGYTPPPALDLELVRATLAPGTSETFDVVLAPALSDGRFLRVDYSAARGPSAGLSVRLASAPLGTGAATGDPQTASAPGTPTDAVTGDFDGDGDEDLALSVPSAANPTGAPGSVIVLLSAGSDAQGNWLGFASQQSFAVGNEPVSLRAADFNRDGRPDLAVANASSNSVSVLLSGGPPGTVLPGAATVAGVGTRPVAVVGTNLNVDPVGNESAPELAVMSAGSNEVRVFTPDASATSFAPVPTATVPLPAGSGPRHLCAFDPDQDKNLRRRRLAVTLGNTNTAMVLDNDSPAGGTVALSVGVSVPVGPSPGAILPADLRPGIAPREGGDLVVASSDGTLSVLLNNTVGEATDVALRPAVSVPVTLPGDVRGVVATDLELDGDADLAVLTPTAGGGGLGTSVQLLRNDYLTRAPSGAVTQSNAQPVFAAGGAPLDGGDDAALLAAGNLSGRAGNPDDLVTVAQSGGGGRGPLPDNVRGLPRRLPSPACNLADVTELGGSEEAPGSPDGQLTVDDLLLFVNLFSAGTGCPGAGPGRCNLADITGLGGPPEPSDGTLTVDDLIAFVNAFSEGC